jgi:SAM-dependent methyltransferase
MEFDVFLCYNSKSQKEAEALRGLLCASGLKVFFAEAKAGHESQKGLGLGLRDSSTVIALVGPEGIGPWHELLNPAWQTVTTMARQIIVVLVKGAESVFYDELPRPRLGHSVENKTKLVFETSLEDGPAFRRLVSSIGRSEPRAGSKDEPLVAGAKEALICSTIEFYETFAEAFVDKWEKDFPGTVITALATFSSRLREGSRSSNKIRVLDAGCGPGHHARAFAMEHGFAVIGIDLCLPFVEYASRRSKGLDCTFLHGDMRYLDSHLGARSVFDGVWACGSCLHLPRESMGLQLNQFRAVLRPGGILGISLQLGPSAVQWDGRFFERYSEEDIRGMLQMHGFRIVDVIEGETTKSTVGRPQRKTWLTLISVAENLS